MIDRYCNLGHYQSNIQRKASRAILNCKTGKSGYSISRCPDCGHLQIHNNSCLSRDLVQL